jgi:hypothetical protein
MRALKRKEFDELAKKGRLIEAKKESLKKLRDEQEQMNKQCLSIE